MIAHVKAMMNVFIVPSKQ